MIAPKSIASRNTIEPLRATIRRTVRAYARNSPARHRRWQRRSAEVATATAGAFRDVPRRRRGIRARDSAPAESRLRTKKNAPSRCRLRPAHPIDLRRSDCRAGVPSTSGAPCSVHSETYGHICSPSSILSRECFANCDNSFGSQLARKFGSSHKCTEVGGSLVRPPNRPPPKRLPVGGPSTSGAPSSVHTGHYGAILVPSSRNRPRNPHFAIFSVRIERDCASACVLWNGKDHGFAEPGALSSTSPADLPLPRTASRESFVLVASRARRSGNLRWTHGPCKGIRRRKRRKLRTRGGQTPRATRTENQNGGAFMTGSRLAPSRFSPEVTRASEERA
jgi:hypothetical protein